MCQRSGQIQRAYRHVLSVEQGGIIVCGSGSSCISSAILATRQSHKRLRVVFIGPEGFFRVPTVIQTASASRAEVTVLKGQKLDQRFAYKSIVHAIWREGLILPEDIYKRMAKRAFDEMIAAPQSQKGRELESLLAFVLSQVPGFRVIDVNYNTMTEEIDVVIENRRVGGMFGAFSEPLILAECKNQQKKAGKNEYVSFTAKVRNRRQTVSVGLFISVNGYTQDFRMEALRDSKDRIVVARFERKELSQWIERWGEAAATFVEERIRSAVME